MLFNSADTFFTVLALEKGATEFNVLMAFILELSMLHFLFVKLIIVNIMILFVGLIGRRYPLGRMGLSIAVSAYALLTCYHLVNLSLLYLTGNVL